MLRRALIGLLVAACSGAVTDSVGSATGAPLGGGSGPAAQSATVTESTYGRVTIRTGPGTRCTVGIHVGPPTYGDLPPTSVGGTADPSGGLTLTYPAPHLPAGTGRHEVRCGAGAASADFAIPAAISAAHFSARILAPALTEQVPGVTATMAAALVAPRDADVAALSSSLASEWSTATRGLSTLDLITTATADIVITVLPGSDTSVHVTAGDGSQAIFLYVADRSGPLTADNLTAVAMHELGHIWCCHGPDASSDGHWAAVVADPLLQGVDRFGLMNHPVQCITFGTIQSCPNRFSDRELRTMGFTQIPAPPRNACVDAKDALLAQLGTTKDQLAAAKSSIDAMDASLATQLARIKALEAQYPNGMPPDVYASYTAMIARYNSDLATERSAIAAYNALLARSNGLVDQVNRLIC